MERTRGIMKVMDHPLVFVVALALSVVLIASGVVTIIVLVGRTRPREGLGADPTGTVGRWNADVRGTGRGILTIESGVLSFLAAGTSAPAWSLPCREVAGRSRSALALTGSNLQLWGQGWVVECTVSREHINHFSRNTIKTLRQQGQADEVLAVLAAHGGQVSPGAPASGA